MFKLVSTVLGLKHGGQKSFKQGNNASIVGWTVAVIVIAAAIVAITWITTQANGYTEVRIGNEEDGIHITHTR